MMGIKWVRQEDPHGCGLAVLSMLTGTPYWRVRADIDSERGEGIHGHDGDWSKSGLSHISIDRYLTTRGFYRQRIYQGWKLGEWPPKPWAPVHYAQVKQPSGNFHFVVMDHVGRVLDPMREGLFSLGDWPSVGNVCGLVIPALSLKFQRRSAEPVHKSTGHGRAS